MTGWGGAAHVEDLKFAKNRRDFWDIVVNRLEKPALKVLLCSPRGFCAGVVRAIESVERALAIYGAPVYVRHEIVHNRYVVESLRAKGAIFVEELDEVPDTGAPVIFSAHGVARSVPAEAERRHLLVLDATCPLVTKVHREADIHHRRGREIVLIGHAGHPEVIGTHRPVAGGRGDADRNAWKTPRVSSRATPAISPTSRRRRLSVDDTAEIVEVLKARFPAIVGPHKDDICYATTNRQEAVKCVAPMVDAMIVVGAPNSSNSQRLEEVAERAGCAALRRWCSAPPISIGTSSAASRRLGITAGASAPEVLVEEMHRRLRAALCARPSRPSPPPRRTCSSRCRARCARPRRRSEPSMAVYTDVTDDELTEFLAGYEIGALLSYKGIAEGVENSNFLVHTSAGNFILTLYEKRVAAERPAVLSGADGASRGTRHHLPAAGARAATGGCSARWPAGRRRSSPFSTALDAPSECRTIARRSARRWPACIWPARISPRNRPNALGIDSWRGAVASTPRRAPTACEPGLRAEIADELERARRRSGRAVCPRASSTPISFPTTCSSSATDCPG